MRIFFFIQGEGRGHQTQAIALHDILVRAGHEVTGAIVGTTPGRGVPAMLSHHFRFPLTALPSPALQYSHRDKGLAVSKTFFRNARFIPRFWSQGAEADRIIAEHRPDLIINFYEMLCGIWQWRYRRPVPVLSVAHQFLLEHHAFSIRHTTGHFHRMALDNVSRLASVGTTLRLALSFYELPDDGTIRVVPPLLRPELKDLAVCDEGFLLAYMTHYKLGGDLENWCRRHPDVRVEAFWDHPDHRKPHRPLSNLVFHPVDATAFLDAMRRCRGLVSTSGFESISEAMYLGKPVMLFPTPRHFEQEVNALDAVHAGAGIRAESFEDLDLFLDYLPRYKSVREQFRKWYNQGEARWLKLIAEVTR